ncbi:hypothetical protein PIB30_088533, partial [Stylosanthes scabra]|nr:hypothetical protein [Stylosanthes scabra]
EIGTPKEKQAKLPQIKKQRCRRNCQKWRCGDGPPKENGETAGNVATVLPRTNWQTMPRWRRNSHRERNGAQKTPKEFKTARSEQNSGKRRAKLERESQKTLGRIPHGVKRQQPNGTTT